MEAKVRKIRMAEAKEERNIRRKEKKAKKKRTKEINLKKGTIKVKKVIEK